MDLQIMAGLAKAGAACALGLAALGSSLGAGAAGQAAIGAWKKAYVQGRPAAFTLVAFVGAPLSQTIYGMILMNAILAATQAGLQAGAIPWPGLLMAGLVGGAAMGASAYYQGVVGAAACDSLGETGQGFGNYLIAIGVVETVALFVMVFMMAVVR